MTIVLLHRELDDSVLLSDGHESRKKKTNQGHDQIVKKKKNTSAIPKRTT